MKNIDNLLKQAQQMQAKMSTLQSELSDREIDVSTGGGMVQIKINGKQEIIDLKIKRECIDLEDLNSFQDLMKTSLNQAVKESQDMVSKAMSKITGGVKIPGLF